ncbi:hypothetical protein HPB51_011653 [Rhipicephalus microplus]|uniref:Uncharacterized protein n=1 Tax=Rhipicephalus microplus TaxID=6941 RepID=A0A9J6ETU1_RHIMP|nr:hypothetical protein HPB51_011653 [Rhipicephalus microplus]
MIREILREELRALCIPPTQSPVASVAEIVCQELRQAVTPPAPSPEPHPASYADVVRRPPPSFVATPFQPRPTAAQRGEGNDDESGSGKSSSSSSEEESSSDESGDEGGGGEEQYNRDVVHPSEVTSVTLSNDVSALRELIRDVIKELQKTQVTASPIGELSVAEMVRAKLQQAIHARQQYEAPQQRHCVEFSYAEAVRRPLSCSSPSGFYPNERCAHQMEVGFSPRSPSLVAKAGLRKSDIRCTLDHRPFCVHCGEARYVY